MANEDLHVVFGVGQVGSQLTDLLLAEGLRVRAVRRSPQTSHHARLECVRADVYDQAAAIQAAAGATVVYHCMNAPYHLWPTQLPPLYRHIAAAAQATGARLVVLDNVYAVGANGVFDETTPERPCSKKGEIRKTLADELGYTGDTNDSASMNVWLHKQVMVQLAENGGIVPDSLRA